MHDISQKNNFMKYKSVVLSWESLDLHQESNPPPCSCACLEVRTRREKAESELEAHSAFQMA